MPEPTLSPEVAALHVAVRDHTHWAVVFDDGLLEATVNCANSLDFPLPDFTLVPSGEEGWLAFFFSKDMINPERWGQFIKSMNANLPSDELLYEYDFASLSPDRERALRQGQEVAQALGGRLQ